MATARHVVEKFKSSDGRIRVKTLSGVSVLVAVIALLVGVLPVFANHGEGELVEKGGGPGGCAFVESDARYELHINNPKTGTYTSPGGTEIRITVDGNRFNFEVRSEGVAVYDAVVNGGPNNLWYAYGDDPVTEGFGLHAPMRTTTQPYNLSHVNLCYDVEPILFVCGVEETAVLFENLGLFTRATAQVFSVNGSTVCEKLGLFFIEDGETTLDFGTGEGVVRGRADFFKQFNSLDDFESLQYDGGPTGAFEEVPWCSTDGEAHADDFDEIDWNPGIPAGHTACKVFETEYADAAQHTAVYFEFEDPNFR